MAFQQKNNNSHKYNLITLSSILQAKRNFGIHTVHPQIKRRRKTSKNIKSQT